MSRVLVNMATLASRLAAIRRATGLAARPFAELITTSGFSISHASVLAYEDEANTDNVPANYILAVARACSYPIAYVLGDTDDPRPPAPPTLSQAAIEELERQVERVRTTLQAVRQPGVLPEPAPEVPPRSGRKPEGSE